MQALPPSNQRRNNSSASIQCQSQSCKQALPPSNSPLASIAPQATPGNPFRDPPYSRAFSGQKRAHIRATFPLHPPLESSARRGFEPLSRSLSEIVQLTCLRPRAGVKRGLKRGTSELAFLDSPDALESKSVQ